MDRPSRRRGSSACVSILALIVLSAAGCTRFAPAVVWFIKGHTIDPVCEKMEERTVAVVCRPQAALTYGNSHAASDLANKTGILLSLHGKEITVIDHQKVSQWTDATPWEDFDSEALAQDTGADMVLLIELHDFGIYKGSGTIYQGNARVSMTLYDCADGGKVVDQRDLPQVLHPPAGGLDASSKPATEFRRWFVGKLADEIGRYYYPHDRHVDIAVEGEAGF